MHGNAKQAIAEHIRNTINNLTGKKQLKAWRPEFIKVKYNLELNLLVNTNWRDICRKRNINLIDGCDRLE
jgi:hypothetical protein